MRHIVILLPLVLVGCSIGSPSSGDNEGKTTQTGPQTTVNIPAEIVALPDVKEASRETVKEAADAAATKAAYGVKTDVENVMKSSHDQLTGQLNLKIDELKKLLDLKVSLENKIDNKMMAQLTAQITTTLQAVTQLSLQIQNTAVITNQMKLDFENKIKALSDIVADLKGSVQGMVDGATGQAGVNNRIEKKLESIQQTISNSAGRDVNYLPKEVVEILGAVVGAGVVILSILAGLAARIAFQAYSAARAREANYARLLMKALSDMEPAKAEAIKREIPADA